MINMLYESDSTAPTAGDEDYTVWTGLINSAVSVWEGEEGMMWNELYKTLTGAADGDKTTTAGDYSYACPTNMSIPPSFVRTINGGLSTYFPVIQVGKVQLLDDVGNNWCYFTGDPNTGYTLHFCPDVTLTTGDTIEYDYYANATKLSSATDKFEMNDPMFAVYWALAELKKEEGNSFEVQMASNKMKSMKTKNIMTGPYADDRVEDLDTALGGDGFGV